MIDFKRERVRPPLDALERHLTRLERHLRRLHTRSDQFTRWRLALFVIGLAASIAGFARADVLGWLMAALFTGGFLVVARAHGRIKHAIRRFETWHTIKRGHIVRMRLDWAAIPLPDISTAPPDHPFALDFDLIGERSVHHLLDTAISRGGSALLRDWLLATTPNLDETLRRQALVRALIPLRHFRDLLVLTARLASLGFKGQFDGLRLLTWLQADAHRDKTLRQAVVILGGLAAANITLFALDRLAGWPPLWLFSFVPYVFYPALRLRSLGGLFDEALRLRGEIARLEAVLRYLETAPYNKHPHLRTLCAPFTDPAQRPSVLIRRITRVLSAASLQRNPLLWISVNLIVPWDVFFADQLERAKGDLGLLLPRWLEALHEIEALCSLAAFADFNPAYTFPHIAPEAVFRARALGHPLLPQETRVNNDFTVDALGRLTLITGSNMAGKSSFLRAVGVNLALAGAGGVVAAESLHVGVFRLFACVRVTDSVVDGFSYFYAEVRRLKALLNALDTDAPAPLFFFIDEIFRGTNNRERLIGSRAFIRALANGRGVGLISTHDLELVKLADELPQITNTHFREEVRDGRMVFDYVLRSGPCPTTNALKIMRLEGLPIPPDAE